MDYKEFDKGKFEDKVCNKIIDCLKSKPMNVFELAKELFGDEFETRGISEKLQKLKNKGIVLNVRTYVNEYYWGLEKSYR